MNVSEVVSVCVRYDLDTFDMCTLYGLRGECHLIWKTFQDIYGGHMFRRGGDLYMPGSMPASTGYSVDLVCMDYQIHLDDHAKYGAKGVCVIEKPEPCTKDMVLVCPDSDWGYIDLLAFMKERALRPASFYEHMAMVGTHRALLGERVGVSFAGFFNPVGKRSSGVIFANADGAIWWRGYDLSYTRGDAKKAKLVAFTAVCL